MWTCCGLQVWWTCCGLQVMWACCGLQVIQIVQIVCFQGIEIFYNLALYVWFVDRCFSVLLYFFLLAIVLSVLLRYTNSDYSFESRINDTLWKLYSLEKGVHALICCRIKLRETNYLNNSNVQQQNHRKRDNWYP